MWGTRAQGASLAGLVVGGSLIAGLAIAQAPENPFAAECNRTASQEDIDGARGAHQAAKQFYDRGAYDDAIGSWRNVLKFDCNAIGTLLNLANAYERLGDRQNAIFALEAYVKRVPEGTDVSKILVRTENLRALFAAQPPAPTSASAAPSASASTPPPLPSATTPPVMVKPHGMAPWVTVGAGAAVMVVGGILIPVGLGNIDGAKCAESSPGSGTWKCPSQEAEDSARMGQTLVPAGKVALGIGAAAVVGGLVWEFVFNKPAPAQTDKPSTGRVRFSPSISPGMTGATLHGTF